jgi:Tfp pilus assembly protein PilN
MKLLRLNLQSQGIEEKKKEFFQAGLRKIILGELIFALFLLGLGLFLILPIASLRQRLSLMEKEWQDTQPLLTKRDYLAEQKNSYVELFILLKDTFKKDISWSGTFRSLSSLVPEEMWFKELVFKEAGAFQVLEVNAAIGYLNSDEEKLKKVDKFLKDLRQDKTLSKIFEIPDLRDMSKTKLKEEEVLELKFTLSLKR